MGSARALSVPRAGGTLYLCGYTKFLPLCEPVDNTACADLYQSPTVPISTGVKIPSRAGIVLQSVKQQRLLQAEQPKLIECVA